MTYDITPTDENYIICKNNNNGEVIGIIKKFNESQNKDSLKNALFINNPFLEKDSIFKNKINTFLFTEDYNYLINQENKNSEWKNNEIDLVKNTLSLKKSKCNIFISKPVYSVGEKMSLVFIKVNNHSSINLFEKKDDTWYLLGNFANSIY